MSLKQYKSGDMQIFYKIIQGSFKGRVVSLGIAFRTYDAPIGYLPFYGVNDFDFSGETSLKEELMARLPINLSSVASPHTLLIKEAAGDPEFTGSGDENSIDIQQTVKKDLLGYAMACASGIFVDGIMTALGGPVIKSLASKLIQSKVKQFIVSKGISGVTKKYLKEQSNFDTGKLLSSVP